MPRFVDRGSRFGLQPGTNGNHCDREAWIVYRTDLPPEAIEEHFDETLGPDGDWWVTPDGDAGLIRVDRWFRFNDVGADVRCM